MQQVCSEECRRSQQWIDQVAQKKSEDAPWDARLEEQLELKLIRAEAEALLKEGQVKK